MREFKFRAWNKKTLIMKLFDFLTLHGWDDGTVFLSGLNSYANDSLGNPDHVYMQCSGRKDTAGIDIYEGDFVALGDGRTTQCKFQNAEFSLFDSDGQQYYLGHSYMGKYPKIIGNIYENPELMVAS